MSNSKTTAIAKHHIIAKQLLKEAGNIEVPALYIVVDEKPQLVVSLMKYFKAYPNRSYDWRRKVARHVGLLYDFVYALNIKGKSEKSHIETLREFVLSYVKGTFSPKNINDPLGLYWPPASNKSAKRLLSSVEAFSDWCVAEGITNDVIAPSADKNLNERNYLKFMQMAAKVKAMSFLGYTSTTEELASRLAKRSSQIIELGSSTDSTIKSAKYMPDWLIPLLMNDGFVTNDSAINIYKKENITAKMITILLLFGGLRNSEPFHLWFNDVVPQIDGTCKVSLRHPSDAMTNMPFEKDRLRKDYLNQRNLMPRDKSGVKSFHAGWKNLAVDQSLSATVFFIHSAAENLFREMFISYIKYRSELMQSYQLRHNTDHPFLFVSKGKGYEGEPYSIAAYNKALKSAYERIERRHGVDIPFALEHGTTPHGMRHYYGQCLVEAGIQPKIVQKAMHHRSVLSQSVYTQPKDALVNQELRNAKNKINQLQIDSLGVDILESLTC